MIIKMAGLLGEPNVAYSISIKRLSDERTVVFGTVSFSPKPAVLTTSQIDVVYTYIRLYL